MKVTLKRLLLVSCIFVISFLVSTYILGVYVHSTDRVINTWKQPNNVKYSELGSAYLSVVEGDISLGRLPFNIERRYYIYAGFDRGTPTYGYVVDYSFHADMDGYTNIERYIKKSKVNWTDEGVMFEEASGQKLFIPKSMFKAR